TDGTKDSIIEWESYHHDNRNTGFLGTPLEQGAQKKASKPKPLTASVCNATMCNAKTAIPDQPVEPYAMGGGVCECVSVPGSWSSSPQAAWGFAAALGLLGLRGRRRSSK